MNCEEYKEAVAADPSFDGGGAHVSGCTPCREYRDQMMALDLRIAQALAVPVPELVMPDLPEIDAGNVVTLPTARRFSGVTRLAVGNVVRNAIDHGLEIGRIEEAGVQQCFAGDGGTHLVSESPSE